jgi:3-oxoacyl-(acyl-carrier-protein) synthase
MSILPPPSTVWISGAGAVSCLGLGTEALWRAALENRSGIHEGLGRVQDNVLNGLPEELRANRILAFSVLAAREAMAQAGWTELKPGDGMILATTTGQILEWDSAFIAFTDGKITQAEFRTAFNHQPLGEWVSALGRQIGHDGPSAMLTSACSASTQALALGAMWIRQGKVKRCLVGGAEVLCDLTTEGFRSLQLLSVNPSTPFDQNRAGINLSEGAAFLCLEAEAKAPLARLSGFGYSTDGYHMTGPHPEGDGSYRAMRDALAKAEIKPSDVSWVHAHGTGSQQNDMSEGLAMARLFGGETPWVSSTKWLHGHSLAASGALESALLVKAMGEGRVLHTRGLKVPDPKIPVKHPREDVNMPIRHILKNTLGFGGANAAIVLSHPEARP